MRSLPVNKAKMEKILDTVRHGGSVSDAALVAGITLSKLHRYLAQHEKFRRMLDKAQAECKVHHLKRIFQGLRQWQASAWYLERVYRPEFGSTDQVLEAEEKVIRTRKVVRQPVEIKRTPEDAAPAEDLLPPVPTKPVLKLAE